MKIELRTVLAAALAASLAAGLGACASDRSASTGGSSETAGEYLDDATVTTKVKAALATDVGAKAATEIKVSTPGRRRAALRLRRLGRPGEPRRRRRSKGERRPLGEERHSSQVILIGAARHRLRVSA